VLPFNAERVRTNAQQATTEDLLDRITVYRSGMEPEAVFIIEDELRRRGVDDDTIEAHAAERGFKAILHADGTALKCSFCHRPAVAQGWGWHWLSLPIWGKRRPVVPVFPRYLRYCSEHEPGAPPPD
jgi:hypothetical protein